MSATHSNWRKRARAVIAEVIAANQATAPAEVVKLIDAAYPFGPRQYHPYKCWLTERRIAIDSLWPVAADAPIARPCPACGAKSQRPCVEFQGAGHGRNHPPMDDGCYHDARITPSSGPLFGEVAP